MSARISPGFLLGLTCFLVFSACGSLAEVKILCQVATLSTATGGMRSYLTLRGGFEDEGGEDDGDRGGGDYRGRGRGRGRGGYRGRGRGGYRRSSQPPDGPIDELKLYVGGIPWAMNAESLKELFSTYGQCEAVIMTDRFSGRSRGFGFVTFQDAAAAAAALQATNGQEVQGRTISVSHARQLAPASRAGPAAASGAGQDGGNDGEEGAAME